MNLPERPIPASETRLKRRLHDYTCGKGSEVKTRSEMGIENNLMTANGGLGKIGTATWIVKRRVERQIQCREISAIGAVPFGL